MNRIKLTLLLTFFCATYNLSAQESDEFIEFNDRKNTVHGIYLGLGFQYGEINKVDTYLMNLKIAYVANRQFEVGFVGTLLYSDLNLKNPSYINKIDMAGAYGGLHLEPILFSKSRVNLSFPLLVGGGAVGLVEEHITNENNIVDKRWKPVFIVEPGANILYNVSRYLQLEAGIKYRLSSRISLQPEYSSSRINGFSAGLGIKVGIFNMGRNRYKKNKV